LVVITLRVMTHLAERDDYDLSTKKARCLATPGFQESSIGLSDQASQEQTAYSQQQTARRNIHRLTYLVTRKRAVAFLFVFQTWP
jgi:hypothetical protein